MGCCGHDDGQGAEECVEEVHCCCCKCPKDYGSLSCLKRMFKRQFKRLGLWFLEIEMGFVWGIAGLSIIVFVFAAIWYIDPALLTLVLQFRQAKCTTVDAAFLIGISNCSWTSCKLGCTREVYQCWQIQVSYEFVSGSEPYKPPWSSLSSVESVSPSARSEPQTNSKSGPLARLYPNVRGCGYPPELNCEEFYEKFGIGPQGMPTEPFTCWVSTMDSTIAMTELNLERAKEEVILSLIPLFIFIVFVLYAFCRLGVFAVCNPLKMCPKSPDDSVNVPSLTPKKLMAYKRGMAFKKAMALAAFQQIPTEEDDLFVQSSLPQTIAEEDPDQLPPDTAGHLDPGGQGAPLSNCLETHAEVLPVRHSADSVRSRLRENGRMSPSGGSSENVDRFRKLRKPFVAFGDARSDPFDDDFDTNTVINDLFGEEIEMMDKERLVARYDVLDLEDIGIDYDDERQQQIRQVESANDSATRITTSPVVATTSFNVSSLRKKSVTSNFTTWDEFDVSLGNSATRQTEMNSSSVKSSAKRNFD